jgi:glyoxylase-like metal-dependent hydrolase (beta-lactamase superfamily II)
MRIECYPYGPLQANSYAVIYGNDAIIIDPCVTYEAMELDSFVVHGIFCTHGHFDHIYEANSLRLRTKAAIIAHEAECPLIISGEGPASISVDADLSVSEPICRLKDGDIITAEDLGFKTDTDLKIEVLHTPGHTSGSICLLFTEKTSTGIEYALFSGDTIFYETIGRTDLGGSMAEMRQSISRLSLLPDEVKVYPGHGPSTTIGHEKRNNPYFTPFQ